MCYNNIQWENKMTHVTITIRIEGEDEYPILRSKDYKDKAAACADVGGIMEFISKYVE